MKNPLRFALLGLVLSLALSGCATVVGEFAIYEPAGALTVAEMDKLALNKIALADQPLISSADIIAYWKDAHEIQLTPQAFQRAQRWNVPVSGAPFVVCVGKQPIYKGAFWTPISSMSYNGVMIMQPTDSASGIIKIQLGYVSSVKIADPRGDARVMKALAQADKLRSKASVRQPNQ